MSYASLLTKFVTIASTCNPLLFDVALVAEAATGLISVHLEENLSD